MRSKGSAEALEVRRRIAAKFLQEGKGIREVARLVGAAPSAVHGWKQALAEDSLEALKAKPHPGRPARLTGEQKAELERLLLEGPLAAGFPTDLWTLTRVAQVIERHFGVTVRIRRFASASEAKSPACHCWARLIVIGQIIW